MKKKLLILFGAIGVFALFGFSTLSKNSALSSINILDAYLRDYNITAAGITTISGDYDNGFVFTSTEVDGSTTNEIQNLSFNSGNGQLSISGGNSVVIPNVASKTFNNNVSRSLNSSYTISTTRDAQVTYSVNLSCTNPLLAGSSSANAFLEYSTDGGSNWTTVSNVTNGSQVTLTVTIQIVQPNTFVLSGMIPANALVRIRSTTSGTAAVSYSRGQEILL